MKGPEVSEPWRGLPRSLADAIEPDLGEIAAEIVATIGSEVPEYARPLEGSFGRGLETGVTEALRQFLALIRDPDAGRGTGRGVYVGLGRGEFRQGRTLDSLQAAYRVGARVAWRRSAAIGQAAGVGPEVLSLLAESMFAYIDELSADSVEGYAEAQSQREGERQSRRRELVALLQRENMPPEPELRAAAVAAGWALPHTVIFLACERDFAAGLGRRLGSDVLVSAGTELGCLVMPDPLGPGRMAAVARATEVGDGPWTVAIGPPVSLRSTTDRSASSRAAGAPRLSGALAWRLTVNAHGMARAGGLARIAVDECLAELILNEVADIAARLYELRLAPLGGLTEAARRRLETTLLSYIGNACNAVATAAELGVHPQTARHRIGKLRELFGPSLDDAKWRFETGLALRAVRVAAWDDV